MFFLAYKHTIAVMHALPIYRSILFRMKSFSRHCCFAINFSLQKTIKSFYQPILK
jgi:hypothetical protein